MISETTNADDAVPEAPGHASVDLWMIQAVIQPFKLDQVTRALENLDGFSGMTVAPVRGFGQEKLAIPDVTDAALRRRETLDDFTSKLRLDVVVSGRHLADDVIAVIARTAHTGNRGDGKIFMWPLARVLRVRTMQEGADAL